MTLQSVKKKIIVTSQLKTNQFIKTASVWFNKRKITKILFSSSFLLQLTIKPLFLLTFYEKKWNPESLQFLFSPRKKREQVGSIKDQRTAAVANQQQAGCKSSIVGGWILPLIQVFYFKQ